MVKVTEHETWTHYEFEVGDLVRLKRDERGLGSWDHKEAGEFGRVVDAGSQHYLGISHHGFTKASDSIAGRSNVSSYQLVPWVMEPGDEVHLKARAIEALKALAWIDVTAVKHDERTDWFELAGHGLSLMHGTRAAMIRGAALPYLMPYLGTGEVADRPTEWKLNESGQALLDSMGIPHEMELAGGGNSFKLTWGRRGTFSIHDKGTGSVQTFQGEKARDLMAANRDNVRTLHDGRMPEIARLALDYPRTLRMGNLKVVELDPVEVEVTHPEGTAVFEGAHAKDIRRACSRVKDLRKWFDARIEILEAKSESCAVPG